MHIRTGREITQRSRAADWCPSHGLGWHLPAGSIRPDWSERARPLPGARSSWRKGRLRRGSIRAGALSDARLSRPDGGYLTTWTFVLEQRQPDSTRLIARARAGPGYHLFGLPTWLSKIPARVVHFVMERKQLLGIAKRAEARARSRYRPTRVA